MLYVDEVIGRGSFGTVYRGRMRSPDGLVRRVAIKVLSEKMSADSRAVARFRDEARLLALIDHPGLVPVYALERFEDRWAVVMGFVDGFELADAARQRAVPPETVRQFGIQVAEILDALWTHPHPETGAPLNVVHRDIKPQNMMVDLRGRIRLLDLGVASARFEARESTTVAGEVAGTLAYMSPQRWARRDDRHAGDIYALGATLLQLATGKPPQEAGSHASEHQAQVRTGTQAVSPALVALIEQAMAYEAEDRPDAAQLAENLRAIGVLEGPAPREWTQQVQRERPGGRGASLDEQSSFIGNHSLGTDTILTTRFFDDATVTQPPGSPPPIEGRSGTIDAETLYHGPSAAPHTPRWRMALGLGAIGGALTLWFLLPTGPSGPPLRVALAPTDPTTVVEEHRPIGDWLGDQLDRPVEFVVANSYSHTADLLITGDADLALMPHRAGLDAMARDEDVRPLATKMIDGTGSVDPYLIVRRDDTGRELADFLGSKVCYADPLSSTGYKLPRAWLRKQGYDPDADFAVHISGDHGQVLKDLISGNCRLGGTFNRNLSTAELRGIPGSRLKVFAMTGESIPHDSMYAGPHTDTDLADRVGTLLVGFDPESDLGTSLIGQNERISGFRAPPHAR